MATDLEPFRRSVVRILDDHGALVGLGLRVSDTLVMTCAHVVAEALAIDAQQEDAPQGTVGIWSAVATGDAQLGAASVVAGGWFPKSHAHGALADLCVLALAAARPMAVGLASISSALSLTGIRCTLLGAPRGHLDDLVPITGSIGEAKAGGRYLLKQDTGYQVEPGCSGAPVCDKASGQVVGMVVQDEREEQLRTAFLIPAAHLRLALERCGAGAITVPSPSLTSLEPVRRWVERGVARLEPALGDQFKRYVDTYAGEPARPLPFVGRDDQIGFVRRRIADGGMTCVIGPAGSGKSAFLLHLARHVIAEMDCVMLFLPVSIRFNTADELRGLRLLYLQLGNLFAELRFSDEGTLDPDDYRERIARGWEFIANQAPRRFLLIIDATDEATGGWIEYGVLPYELPDNLALVVSTRTGSRCQAPDWLARQRRMGGAMAECAVISLPPLSLDSLRDAVRQLGDPYGAFLSDDAAMRELYRLTDDGDPLLVTLWVEQLRQSQGATHGRFIEQLRGLPSGIDGYLDVWFKEQQVLWKTQDRPFSREQFEPILHIFSVAAGPITAGDVAELAAILELPCSRDRYALEALLASASRLLVRSGDGGALAFVHPRLGYYYRDLLQQSPARWTRMVEAFLSWGRARVAALERRDITPAPCPAYLLNHYTEHVKNAGLDPARALNDYLLPLVRAPHWRQAWLDAEGSYSGFLSDIARIELFIEAAGPAYLAQLLHCCLCRASIRSSTGRIPAKLIGQLVAANLWSIARAERTIALLVDTNNQIAALVTVAGLARRAQGPVLERALDVAIGVEEPDQRAAALAIVIPALAGFDTLLERTLVAIAALPDGHADRLLAACIPALAGNHALIERALAAHGRSRPLTLASLFAHVGRQRDLFLRALAQVALEPDQEVRLDILIAAAKAAPADAALVAPILEMTEGFEGNRHYCLVLAQLLDALDTLPPLLERTLAHIGRFNQQWRCWALQTLLPILTAPVIRRHADALFSRMTREGDWIALLAGLLPAMHRSHMAHDLLQVAIDGFADPVQRAQAVLIIGSALPVRMPATDLEGALQTLIAIPQEAGRAQALKTVLVADTLQARSAEAIVDAIASLASERLRGELLTLAVVSITHSDQVLRQLGAATLRLEDGLQRDLILEALFQTMYPWSHLQDDARRLAACIGDAEVLLRTARVQVMVDPAERRTILRPAFAMLASIAEPEKRARLAEMFIPEVADYADLRPHWLAALGPLDDDRTLLSVIRLAQGCMSSDREAIFLDAVEAIGNAYRRLNSPASLLITIARTPSLPPDVVHRVLDCLGEKYELSAYCALARHGLDDPALFERLLDILALLAEGSDELLVELAQLAADDSRMLAQVLAARDRLDDPENAGRIAVVVANNPSALQRLLEMTQHIGDEAAQIDAARLMMRQVAECAVAGSRTLPALDRFAAPVPRGQLQAYLVPQLDAAQRQQVLAALIAAAQAQPTHACVEALVAAIGSMSLDRNLYEPVCCLCRSLAAPRLQGRLLAAVNRVVEDELLPYAMQETLGLSDPLELQVALLGFLDRAAPAPGPVIDDLLAALLLADKEISWRLGEGLANYLDTPAAKACPPSLQKLLDAVSLMYGSTQSFMLSRIAPLLERESHLWTRYAHLALKLPRSIDRDYLLKRYLLSFPVTPASLRRILGHARLFHERDTALAAIASAVASSTSVAQLEAWGLAICGIRDVSTRWTLVSHCAEPFADVADHALPLARRYLSDPANPERWNVLEARIRTTLARHPGDVRDYIWEASPGARAAAQAMSLKAAASSFLWYLAYPPRASTFDNGGWYWAALRARPCHGREAITYVRRIGRLRGERCWFWQEAAQHTTARVREWCLRRAVDTLPETGDIDSAADTAMRLVGCSSRPAHLMLYIVSRRRLVCGDRICSEILRHPAAASLSLPGLLAIVMRNPFQDTASWIGAWGAVRCPDHASAQHAIEVILAQVPAGRNGYALAGLLPALAPYPALIDRTIALIRQDSFSQEQERWLTRALVRHHAAHPEQARCLLQLTDRDMDDSSRAALVKTCVDGLPVAHPLALSLTALSDTIGDEHLRFDALLALLKGLDATQRLPALDLALGLAAAGKVPAGYCDAMSNILALVGGDAAAIGKVFTSIGSATISQLRSHANLTSNVKTSLESVTEPVARYDLCRQLVHSMQHQPRPIVLGILAPALADSLQYLRSDTGCADSLRSIAQTSTWWP